MEFKQDAHTTVAVSQFAARNVPLTLQMSAKLTRFPCLLYTSDAADERSSVDLGGRRHGSADEDADHRDDGDRHESCLLYTSPSPRDRTRSRMPSSA